MEDIAERLGPDLAGSNILSISDVAILLNFFKQ